VFSVMLAQEVLVSGGGAEEKFMAVGLGNTNWLCAVQWVCGRLLGGAGQSLAYQEFAAGEKAECRQTWES